MSLMFLTRSDSVTTTVPKRAVTCGCVSRSKNDTPTGRVEESRHLIPAAEGSVSHHR